MNWKRIKDCIPPENEKILAFTENGPVVGYWVPHENGICDEPDGVSSFKWAFTHWMSIEPPAEKQAQQPTSPTHT